MHPGGGLRDPYHYDVGSLITVDVMLEEAEAGGEFQTSESKVKGLMTHRFEAGDALVFLGHKYHCVNPVTKGRRRVLVVELWAGTERCCGHRCEHRWKRCTFGTEKKRERRKVVAVTGQEAETASSFFPQHLLEKTCSSRDRLLDHLKAKQRSDRSMAAQEAEEVLAEREPTENQPAEEELSETENLPDSDFEAASGGGAQDSTAGSNSNFGEAMTLLKMSLTDITLCRKSFDLLLASLGNDREAVGDAIYGTKISALVAIKVGILRW
eukprot:symbB.v1.2.009137.t1/scaffold577.1/size258142/12